MKRCPRCRRKYSDDTLNFCLDDGSTLIAEPDSERTLIAPTVAATTPARITSSPSQSSTSSPRWVLVTVIVLLAFMLGGGGVALFYRINKWDSSNVGQTSTTSSATPETKTEDAPGKSNHPTSTPVPAKPPNLSGEWNIVNTIERTSYPAYANLRIGYHLVITQTGAEFTADGQKVSENGRMMADDERTPIHVTGSVTQSGVSATFVEEGQRRRTSGSFEWTLTADGNQLRGTFASTAAKSGGSSVATRER
jgi:hypothetical protein